MNNAMESRAVASGRSAVSMGSSTARHVETDAFRAINIRFAPGLQLPRHHHGDANLVVTLRGRFERTSAHQRVACSPGTVFTEPAGEPHANAFGDDGAEVLIVQPVGLSQSCSPREHGLFQAPRILENPGVWRIAAEVAAEVKRPDAFSILAIDGLVLHMLALALRIEERMRVRERPAWLRRVVETIHDSTSRRVTLTELAAPAGVHPGYLAKVFRATYGLSLARFARNVRLEAAARSLASSTRPIGEIALAAGFADQSHFTHAFRALKGVTPAHYRRATSGRMRPADH